MTPEARSAEDYRPRQTEAARRVLIDLGQVLLAFALFSVPATVGSQESHDDHQYHASLYGGVDVVAKGARLGVLVSPMSHFSIELSYGRDALDFITDWDARTTVGINWHELHESNLFVGLAYSHASFIQMNTAQIKSVENFISLMVGSYEMSVGGIQFFWRGGCAVKVDDTSARNIVVYPNIDIGINLNVFSP